MKQQFITLMKMHNIRKLAEPLTIFFIKMGLLKDTFYIKLKKKQFNSQMTSVNNWKKNVYNVGFFFHFV